MNIFICCSKAFYDKVEWVRGYLQMKGHDVVLPNSYDNPAKEQEMYHESKEAHRDWKAEMFRVSEDKIKEIDAMLVLNFEKNGQQNYVGGATFIEMYEAFRNKKKIFLYNPIPEGMLKDEIESFDPKVIEGNLELIVDGNTSRV